MVFVENDFLEIPENSWTTASQSCKNAGSTVWDGPKDSYIP